MDRNTQHNPYPLYVAPRPWDGKRDWRSRADRIRCYAKAARHGRPLHLLHRSSLSVALCAVGRAVRAAGMLRPDWQGAYCPAILATLAAERPPQSVVAAARRHGWEPRQLAYVLSWRRWRRGAN